MHVDAATVNGGCNGKVFSDWVIGEKAGGGEMDEGDRVIN